MLWLIFLLRWLPLTHVKDGCTVSRRTVVSLIHSVTCAGVDALGRGFGTGNLLRTRGNIFLEREAKRFTPVI